MRRLASRSLARILAPALLAAAASAQVLFSEDFEGGGGNWDFVHLWHLSDDSLVCLSTLTPFPSGSTCARMGSDTACNYGFDPFTVATLTTAAPISLPDTSVGLSLSFWTASSTEVDPFFDTKRVQISLDAGTTWNELELLFFNGGWSKRYYDLSAFAGHDILLRFRFWAVDDESNFSYGWMIDDIEVRANDYSGVPFCSGALNHGSCPCSNPGALDHGCANSFNPDGAKLYAAGEASVSADTLVLLGEGSSNSFITYFQGSQAEANSQNGSVFGDGLRCAGGSILRLKTFPAMGGISQYPEAGDPSISVKGMVPNIGGQFYYQTWYRNSADFCTSGTFNLSNGWKVQWLP